MQLFFHISDRFPYNTVDQYVSHFDPCSFLCVFVVPVTVHLTITPQQQQREFVVQWVGRARLALSFVSGCPGRGVPAFLGCDLRVRAQLPGWWLCAHAGPSFVILGYPGPVGGSNRVQPIYTLYARRRCTSVVLFVQIYHVNVRAILSHV